jgi:hypothetical protein
MCSFRDTGVFCTFSSVREFLSPFLFNSLYSLHTFISYSNMSVLHIYVLDTAL